MKVVHFASLAVVFNVFGSIGSLKLAEPCDLAKCKLPKCKCSSYDSGSNITVTNTPQIVMLSFDDGVTRVTYDYFARALFNLKNPDGCPIGVTHFLSHEYADYVLVNDLWQRGHEIALHSVTHSPIDTYWENISLSTFESEFGDMREIATNFAKIPRDDIQGMRLPFLQVSGNVSFEGMTRLNLTYDSSMPSRFVNPAIWPYTLEYASSQDCMIQPCPTASFPDIWEVPMAMWFDLNNVPCSMVDGCITVPNKTEPLLRWIIEQFNRHYNSTRAPFPVFMHAAWFLRNPENFEAYKLFIDYIQKLPDVYIVTVKKTIDWIKDPKPLTNKKPFGECDVRKATGKCVPLNCQLKNKNGEDRWMRSCAPTCPHKYPWLGNPLGK